MTHLLLLIVSAAAIAGAQTMIDLRTQGKNVDFSKAATTAPIKTAGALPGMCSLGEFVFLTTAPVGSNLYACVATNTWSLQGNGLSSTELETCRIVRSSPSLLTINSCTFAYPNQDRKYLSGLSVSAVSGTGTAYVYASPRGTIEVVRNGTLTIGCNGCNDAGVNAGFPDDVIRIGTWSATTNPGEWDSTTSGIDDRPFITGPTQIRPGGGIMISTSLSGEKEIAVDSAVLQTRAAAQAGQETLCLGSGTAASQNVR